MALNHLVLSVSCLTPAAKASDLVTCTSWSSRLFVDLCTSLIALPLSQLKNSPAIPTSVGPEVAMMAIFTGSVISYASFAAVEGWLIRRRCKPARAIATLCVLWGVGIFSFEFWPFSHPGFWPAHARHLMHVLPTALYRSNETILGLRS